MIRYIIEKNVCNDYIHGTATLMENGSPKMFSSEKEAMKYLNDLKTDAKEIAEVYNIKQCII